MRPVKCVLLGDSAVGKTASLMTYSDGIFPSKVPSNYETYSMNVVVDGCPINLGLWDSFGEDRISSFATSQADVFVVMFSIVSRSSFGNAQNKWIPELRESFPDVPILLVGSKIDLREVEDFPHIPREEALSLSDKLNVLYYECSALQNKGLKEVFDAAVRAVLTPKKKPLPPPPPTNKCCQLL
uniref:Uncharacterized protein n=1 Tax=Arcella intermedia TaxID=1963864 RepID=A0A6B2LKQ1_9EUKA